ncbi:unnamed protein product [Aphanomyces euteiches]
MLSKSYDKFEAILTTDIAPIEDVMSLANDPESQPSEIKSWNKAMWAFCLWVRCYIVAYQVKQECITVNQTEDALQAKAIQDKHIAACMEWPLTTAKTKVNDGAATTRPIGSLLLLLDCCVSLSSKEAHPTTHGDTDPRKHCLLMVGITCDSLLFVGVLYLKAASCHSIQLRSDTTSKQLPATPLDMQCCLYLR